MFILQTIGGWQCTKQSTQHTCRKFSKIQGWAPQETFPPENNCFPSLLPWLKPRETHFFSTRLVGCPELLTDKNQTKVAKSLPVKKRKDKISWTFTFRLHIFLILLPSLFINSTPLFVFSTDDPKQNAASLLTPVFIIVFYALLSGTLGFALHGSFISHFLIGGNS